MNPLTNMKNMIKMNDRELETGLINTRVSWHNKYKDSAWIFVGGLQYDLTEGDVICVFSQYGEIVNINLIRDQKTGKSKGFAFLCYEDQRSTILAVDNFNGIKIGGRIIRVDHVENYKVPKEHDNQDESLKVLHREGCAPKPEPLVPSPVASAPAPSSTSLDDTKTRIQELLRLKSKKLKKLKKEKKKKSSRQSKDSEDEKWSTTFNQHNSSRSSDDPNLRSNSQAHSNSKKDKLSSSKITSKGVTIESKSTQQSNQRTESKHSSSHSSSSHKHKSSSSSSRDRDHHKDSHRQRADRAHDRDSDHHRRHDHREGYRRH